MADFCAVEPVRLSPWSAPIDGGQLGDGERMNCKNVSSSPKARSADKPSREGDISGRHTEVRGMLFLTGLSYILSKSKRKDSVVNKLSVNSRRGVLQAIMVSWLKTKDGQTVGLMT